MKKRWILLFLGFVLCPLSLLAVEPIAPEEVVELIGSEDVVILDVREEREYEKGHIPGAKLMPWNSGVLQEKWEELPKDKTIIVHCASGFRSALAAQFLEANGFQDVRDLGGFYAYSALPDAEVETGPYEEDTPVRAWACY